MFFLIDLFMFNQDVIGPLQQWFHIFVMTVTSPANLVFCT